MDLIAVKDVIIGTAAVLAAGVSIWTLLQSPSKKNAEAIGSAVSKLTEHDRRIQSLENELRHLPSKEAVHELKVAIVELQGTVKAQNVQLEAVGRSVANIDGYLRKGDEK
jgi:Protein of unknown function (DUF2730)